MKFKLIGCGVFRGLIEELAKETEHLVDVDYLEAGMHARPRELNEELTRAVQKADGGGFDAVLLAYGLCNRGPVNLCPGKTKIVIPRAHDCITIFLGSLKRYREQFSRFPGTFYFCQYWIDNKGGPRLRRDATKTDRYLKLEKEYGAENARHITEFYESWRRNYQRAAYIRFKYDRPEMRSVFIPAIRRLAKEEGWNFEEIEGDVSLLRDLMGGKWDEERFVIVEPGQKVTISSQDRVMDVIAVGAGPVIPRETRRTSGLQPVFHGPQVITGMGIDAGGTYTDAVIYDVRNNKVLCKSKALTTKHDLTEGIIASVDRLDVSLFRKIDFVCISTTLATNAIVEGKGDTVGLIVLPPPIFKKGDIRQEPKIVLGSRMGMAGNEIEPIDGTEARNAVRSLVEEHGAKAIAISGFAAVSNPAHELRVKAMAREMYDLPVLCGHELSMGLNFKKRANTAVLNAQLMPIVRELLKSVKRALAERGIEAPVMVVKCDGTLMSEEMAHERPIETILSGPAASVIGAINLSGVKDATVIDMGGTTSDVAKIRRGEAIVTPHGARVGEWDTNVRAADILTSGLGGDSYVKIRSANEIAVGPERVVPLSLLAQTHPGITDELESMRADSLFRVNNAQPTDFFLFVRDVKGQTLSSEEQKIVDAVRERPVSRIKLSQALRCLHPSLVRTERLEKVGIVQRSSLTPSDVLHALGEFTTWDVSAAKAALKTYAQMCGVDAQFLADRILDEVRRKLGLLILMREFLHVRGVDNVPGCAVCRAMVDNLFSQGRGWDFTSSITLKHPIVAIGAPVSAYLPDVGEVLGTPVVIPSDADVANAIGAVTADVVIEEEISIRPSSEGGYSLHSRLEKREFSRLPEAREYAAEQVTSILKERGTRAGASTLDVQVDARDRISQAADGANILLETVVRGRILSKPVVGHVKARS